ncbi:MAG: ABC transporter ATP-binding protein [Nitrososphaerota archaeon]|nr:ABC transporter ATP-binding protein [Nitrososphaerota archaeon]
MIETRVKKKLGTFLLSVELADEGFICLIGRNGSGKSTFMKVVAGQLPIDEGFVKVDGVEVSKMPVERRGVVLVTPGSSIPHLEVDKHLVWGARHRRVRVDLARVALVKERLGIDFTGRASALSLGMKERLALATALLSEPRVILVDEAFSNLHDRRGFISSYRTLATEAGIDVIFSTQDEADASLADHVYSMSEGVLTRCP